MICKHDYTRFLILQTEKQAQAHSFAQIGLAIRNSQA